MTTNIKDACAHLLADETSSKEKIFSKTQAKWDKVLLSELNMLLAFENLILTTYITVCLHTLNCGVGEDS